MKNAARKIHIAISTKSFSELLWEMSDISRMDVPPNNNVEILGAAKPNLAPCATKCRKIRFLRREFTIAKMLATQAAIVKNNSTLIAVFSMR